MTRQQYEQIYGVKPVASSSDSFDTKPAPIRMTRAEYESQYYPQQEKNSPVKNVLEQKPAFPAKTENAGVLGNIARYTGNIPGAVVNLARSVVEPIVKAPVAVIDTAKEIGVGETIKALAPSALVTTVLKGGFNMWKDAGEAIYKNLEQNVIGTDSLMKGVGLSTAQGASKLAEIVINDPTLVPSLLYAPKVVKGKDIIADVGSIVTKPIDKTTIKIRAGLDEKAVKSVADEIHDVETAYVKTRKANEFSRGADEASRIRIAQSNVLDGAVDMDGKILTKGPDGAIAKYKAQTVDGIEDVVRLNLQKENKSVALSDVEKHLKENIILASNKGIGFEGSDLVTALNGVKKEIAGLRLRADTDGNVPLYKIHDAKISTTNKINFATPASEGAYRKSVASAYKTFVEKNSDFNVEEVNKVIGEYKGDIARLERLDGARVKGGRLGKYTASLAGTGIGMAAGSVGGGVGAAIGGVIGGEMAQLLKGASMSRSFAGGGKGLTKSPVLTKATESIAFLKKADEVVTAPKNIKKTKEITALENKIAENVEQQKKAIKAGDFTLVATLKEVYAFLVTKLKDALKYLDDNASVGMSIKKTVTPESVAKKADKDDMKILANLIDDYDNAILDPITSRILSDMGLGRATKEERISFAKEVFDEKDGVAMRDVIDGDSKLFEEAKKYKSAEEFVNNKINVFHATNEAQARSIESSGYKPSLGRGFSNTPGDFAYFTPSVDGAIRYSKTSSNGLNKITSGHLKGNILKIEGVMPDFEAFGEASRKLGVPLGKDSQGNLSMLDVDGLKKALQENGYSAIEFKDRYSNGARAIATIPEDVLTKSQLTDIWKEANRKASEAEK